MNGWPFRSILILVLAFLIPAFSSLTSASTSTPQKDHLIKFIKGHARQDIKLEKPTEGVRELGSFIDSFTAAVQSKSWWKYLKPLKDSGWVVAVILFILLICRDVLKENITKLIKWIEKQIYNSLAGYSFFHKTALSRYRQNLIKKYYLIKIPFWPDRSLNMREVYIPLKVRGTNGIEPFDAYRTIVKHKRLVVIGPPGSGKTMLLRHITLSYAECRLKDFPDRPIIILVELNRFNDADEPIEAWLVTILQLNDFPHAENFIRRRLKDGKLILLFDGLDELNSSRREQVVNNIEDLLVKYDQCRVVITCRNAIYNNELATLINNAYEIVEFSDQEIYKFLISCQESTLTNESIDQLIGILHERPKIMALARNPLLLTIIAYLLYNDKEFVLPYSRTEFYAHAKNVLLRQWKQERNRYKASDKQLVLQHLALFNQDRRLELKQDWLSMDRKVILKEIKKVLPDLNLLDSDAVPLLDEIVERSGLLLSIESGINYQFAHSTLQEFFVAIGLRNDAKSLVNRFKKDRPAWREIVKLWCGLDQDSTKLIQLIYEEDPITAFECLGDAHQINPALADQIINTFKSRLGETGSNGEAISRAFAIVASDPRPRGRDILTFLVNTLTNTVSDSRRTSAATSLSLTNLPKAAQVLGIYYTTHTDMRTALIQTGDLAVPILADLAKGGDVEPLNDLQAIGTPRAARALVSLLWGENKFASCQAAWRLAAILPEPNIKVILRDYPLTEDQRRAEWLTWIWEPFNEPCNSAMPIITGRVAYLMMEQVPVNLISTTTLDLRLVVPLCSIYGTRNHGFDVVEIFKLLDKISKSEGELTLTQLPKLLDGFTKDNQDPKIVEVKKKLIQIIENGDLPKKFIVNWLYMFCNLPLQLKADLSEVLINEPGITINDWQNVSYSLKYEFKTSWHYRVILFLNFIVSLIALVRATDIFWHSSTLIGWGSGFFIAIFIIISWLLLYNSDFDPKHFERSFWGRLLGKTFTPHGRNHKSLFRIIYEGFQDSFFEGLTSLFEVWLDHMGVIPMVGVGCFSTMYFVNIFPFKFLLIIWLMWLVTCVILWQSGWQSERKAKNPLYGIYGYIEKLCHESDLDI